ncbi:hypothetical protein DPEC_G00101880, partial [Dallia pectoralis]
CSVAESPRLALPQGDSGSDECLDGGSPAGSPRPEHRSLGGLLRSTHRAILGGGSLLASVALGRDLDIPHIPPRVPPRTNPPPLDDPDGPQQEVTITAPKTVFVSDPPVVDDLITFSSSEPLPLALFEYPCPLHATGVKPQPLTPPPPHPRERACHRHLQAPQSPKSPRAPRSPRSPDHLRPGQASAAEWGSHMPANSPQSTRSPQQQEHDSPADWAHYPHHANGESLCDYWSPGSVRRSSHGQLGLDLPLCQDSLECEDKSSSAPFSLFPDPRLWSPKTPRLEVNVVPRPRPSPNRPRIDPWSFISAGGNGGFSGVRSPRRSDGHPLGYQPSPTNPFTNCDPFPSADCDPFSLRADPLSCVTVDMPLPFDPFSAPFPTSRSAPCSTNGSPTLPTFRLAHLNPADSPLIDLGWAAACGGGVKAQDITKEKVRPRRTLVLKPFKSPMQLRDDRF